MNHRPVLLFAGTSEGRELAEYCIHNHIPVWASAATEYGEFLLPDDPAIEKLTGYLDEAEMEELLREQKFSCVIDATHPYAVHVTENVKKACETQHVPYYRVVRGSQTTDYEKTVYVSDLSEAVEWLNQTEGHIFDQTGTLTGILAVTGSKELSAYDGLANKDSLFVRILPSIDSLKLCAEAGIPMSHIIAMQGPFSVEANVAVMKQYNCGYMVTKESGQAGGFAEKIEACRQLGAVPIVIRRPVEEQGMSMGEMKSELAKIYDVHFPMMRDRYMQESALYMEKKECEKESELFQERNIDIEDKIEDTNQTDVKKKTIILAGIGMGNPDTMTQEVRQAIFSADAVIGGKRMVKAAKELLDTDSGRKTESELVGVKEKREAENEFVRTNEKTSWKHQIYYESYLPGEIADWIKQHTPHCPVVLMSGDTGFYSGTKKLIAELEGYEVRILPGISSIAYLSAKFGLSWEDACICSIHGRKQNVPAKIRTHEKVFSILGKGMELQELCRQLTEQSMGNVTVYAGSHLSYPEEQLWTGTAAEAAAHEFADLCAVIFINKQFQREILIQGIPEEAFIRDKVPMTKEEIRVLSLAKLHLTRDAVVYDIGAGTGSVSVEAALAAGDGCVYAIERKPLAADLIHQNCQKFGLANVTVVEGTAPEALSGLPVPTHVFIGGSAGKLKELIALLYEKNPEVRIVVNAIALETIGEITELAENYHVDMTQIQVAKSKNLGNYHLMMGQNPVMIAVICGRNTCQDIQES